MSARITEPPPPPVLDSAFRFAARTAGLKPSAIREILKTTETPDIISFAGGLPASELFPVADVSRAAQDLLADEGPAALQYGVTEGYLPLREWVCAHLAVSVGLQATPDRVLITHGSQQGLDLLARVLLDPGDTVLVENPSYLGALQVFRSYQAKVEGLPCDDQGLRPESLAAFLASAVVRPKFLYLIPNFQNPTGSCLPAGRRAEIAAIAARFGLPVIEDDPYGALRFSGTAAPALGAFPSARNCVYLGTSSKILAPGLRVAWLVTADRGLHEKLVAAKQATDLHTSSFTQRLVSRYVAVPGQLDTHVARLLDVYSRRRDALLAALARELPREATWTRPDGGLFLWVRLPEAINTLRLLPLALQARVAFVPGAPFWVGSPVQNTLRLNFSNAGEACLAEGIFRLGRVIRDFA